MSSENKEIWKKIEDYDYVVSNFGRIKNLKNNNLLKPQDNRNGYLKVCLSKHGSDQEEVKEICYGGYGKFSNKPDRKYITLLSFIQ